MKKTVLITGASGDIGKALSTVFAGNNWNVVGTYYENQQEIKKLARKIGSDFCYFQQDLSDFNQITAFCEQLFSLEIYPDLLINNAGISLTGLIQDLTLTDWNRIWNTNVTSVVAMCGQMIPAFLKKGGGKIINISSVWGNNGASFETAYSATKGAVNAFTKALAKELAPSDIQVNAVSCGIIDTKMNSRLSSEDIELITREIPVGRMGTVDDVAQTVYAIANLGSYVTGQIFTVDGGWQV